MATTQTKLGPADHGRRMTLDEFREADETAGYRFELARGVLEVSEVPGRPHWRIVDNLHEAMSRYRRQFPGVIDLIGHGSDVRLQIPAYGSDRHPDLGVVLIGDPEDDRGRPRPGLVVEVVSAGSGARDRDYVTKREEYLAVGVGEYWIVDPRGRRVTVLSREGGADGPTWRECSCRDEEEIASGLLPGFEATVAELWRGVDLDAF